MRSMKKDTQTQTAASQPTRDDYTVVLEDLRDNFRAFGENLEGVRGTLNTVARTVDTHTEMIGRILMEISEIKHVLQGKAERTEHIKLEKRLALLETFVYGKRQKT